MSIDLCVRKREKRAKAREVGSAGTTRSGPSRFFKKTEFLILIRWVCKA
mgnify:CR=1 FL=1